MYQPYSHKNRDGVSSFGRTGLLRLRILFITAVLLVLSASFLGAQSSFYNLYGSLVGEQGEKVINVPGGGYLIGGQTEAGGFGSDDIALTRVDATGALLWCTKIGATDREWLNNIVAIPQGGFYALLSSVDSFGVSYSSTIVVKLDASGNVLWSQEYTGLTNLIGSDVISTSSGGFVFLATEDSLNPVGTNRVRVVSCNAGGTVVWSNKYMVTGMSNYRQRIVECPNGDFLVAWATTPLSQSVYSISILRINSSGTLLWCKESAMGLWEEVRKMVYANNHIFVVTQRADSVRLNCFDSAGNALWRHSLLTSGGWNVWSLDYANGKLLLSGLGSYQNIDVCGVLVEFDTTGALLSAGQVYNGVGTFLWEGKYNSNNDIVLTGYVLYGFGANDTSSVFLNVGNIAAGTLCGYSPISVNVFTGATSVTTTVNISTVSTGAANTIAMMNSTGTMVQTGCIVGVGEERTPQAELYPNPVSDMLTISTTSTSSTFHLFNSQGQGVMMNNLTGDRNEISVAGLSPGIYYYRLEAESGEVSSGKLVVH